MRFPEFVSIADRTKIEPPSDDSSISDSLLREIRAIGGGALSGIKSSLKQAVDQPGDSLAKLGIAAVAGAGLALLQRRAGFIGLAARIAAGSLGVSLLTDVAGRAGTTWHAIEDTWRSPDNLDRNQRIIAGTIGPFLVDTALFMAGGAAGAGSARGGVSLAQRWSNRTISIPMLRSVAAHEAIAPAGEPRMLEPVKLSGSKWELIEGGQQYVRLPGLEPGMPAEANHAISLPAKAPLARLYQQALGSVAKIEVIAGGNPSLRGEVGSGFAVSNDGKIATAFHVVDNALSVSVFDLRGRPHQARVVATNPDLDLAVLQLEQAPSYALFKPMPLGDVSRPGSDTGVVAAFGHPNGWNVLYASPGRLSTTARQSPVKARFEMRGEHGNSGGPIVDHEGNVIAVLIQSPRTATSAVDGTPARFLSNLLEQLRAAPVTSTTLSIPEIAGGKSSSFIPLEALRETAKYSIADAKAAVTNIESLFGSDVLSIWPLDFFHSKVKKVTFTDAHGKPAVLVLKTEFNPADVEITVRPIGLNGKAIPAEAMWPASTTRINDAQLKLVFNDRRQPIAMESQNDPLAILPRAFDYRGENNYLAGLKPDSAVRSH